MTIERRGVGIWSSGLRYGDAAEAAECAGELEALGYSSLWVPDVGGDLFGAVERLLAATTTATVATGILNLWMHTAAETATRDAELVDRYGERIMWGIGVSHAPLIDSAEQGRYRRPLERTRRYLDELDAEPGPVPPSRRMLAALGPKMLELARTRTAGTHQYLVTPDHTAAARDALGSSALVVPEQALVPDTDPDRARALGRAHLAGYIGLPNYVNNWKRLGFTDDDVADGGSDRLVDALVAWGDDAALRARVDAHFAAGADHVCVQILSESPIEMPMQRWRQLAPTLLG